MGDEHRFMTGVQGFLDVRQSFSTRFIVLRRLAFNHVIEFGVLTSNDFRLDGFVVDDYRSWAKVRLLRGFIMGVVDNRSLSWEGPPIRWVAFISGGDDHRFLTGVQGFLDVRQSVSTRFDVLRRLAFKHVIEFRVLTSNDFRPDGFVVGDYRSWAEVRPLRGFFMGAALPIRCEVVII
jgi:hypothetical protein